MTKLKKKKTICFVHYGIGWKDGVNVVLTTLTKEIKRQEPNINICFIAGEIKKRILEKADYKRIPELIPETENLDKKYLENQSLKIAKELREVTKGAEAVIIENPFMGFYHLPAMKGFSIYAKDYKPESTKVFFRIHDIYSDAPQYTKILKEFFSATELRKIVRGDGVDGFLIVNRGLKKTLIEKGVPSNKIFYLPNGVESKTFDKKLTKKNSRDLLASLGFFPQEEAKPLLCPVRVVPRKNLEEAVLLTYYIREITKDNYVLIVSGKIDRYDPLSKAYYKGLKKLIKAAGFPVVFTEGKFPFKREYDIGGKIKRFCIGDLYQAADAVMMTSFREGFGYPFLECWFAKKIIIGRKIENVVKDFEKAGLNFKWLYKNFLIKRKEPSSILIREGNWLNPFILLKNILNKLKNRKGILEDLSKIKREEYLEGANMIIDILKDEKIRNQTLKQNKKRIMKQIEILKNEKKREKIIRANLKTVRKEFEISSIARLFLKIIK